MIFMICENCGINAKFKELGHDKLGNLILECQDCGAVCYEDGTLVEDDVKIVE